MNFEKTALGIELGSTRIKAVLIDDTFTPIASGSHDWENRLIDGVWTYTMDDIHSGLQHCYAELKQDVLRKFGEKLTKVGVIGISAMMHGYLPFDKNGEPLTAFRTWRNTMTGEAAARLTDRFQFNIPQRWSVAHLYQAMLNKEPHLERLDHINTLAGYVHEKLTGCFMVGIGEASGIFPIDPEILYYHPEMRNDFNEMIEEAGYHFKLEDLLPNVQPAGYEYSGRLTKEGAAFLDPEGDLQPGIPFAPPEGDAGTGMTATNSVAPRTGNVSAGTSDFAMIVLEKDLKKVHREIDMVTTPTGVPVAMVHCNNCTSDINAWVGLLDEFAKLLGSEVDRGDLYVKLFNKALEGDPDCGGLLSYNYFSGEGVTDLDAGRPVFARKPDAKFTLANFMRTHILSALATLKIGLDILTQEEHVGIDKLYGHGGFFKTPVVGQKMMSAAINAPVSVMETAGEGGPYGMALLAAYRLWKEKGQTLEDYLENVVFANAKSTTLMADTADVEGFARFLDQYKKSLPVEVAAIETL